MRVSLLNQTSHPFCQHRTREDFKKKSVVFNPTPVSRNQRRSDNHSIDRVQTFSMHTRRHRRQPFTPRRFVAHQRDIPTNINPAYARRNQLSVCPPALRRRIMIVEHPARTPIERSDATITAQNSNRRFTPQPINPAEPTEIDRTRPRIRPWKRLCHESRRPGTESNTT